ncbi:MAG: hypothetical protein DMG64_13185, partial [Acidobacteria bacterium]
MHTRHRAPQEDIKKQNACASLYWLPHGSKSLSQDDFSSGWSCLVRNVTRVRAVLIFSSLFAAFGMTQAAKQTGRVQENAAGNFVDFART